MLQQRGQPWNAWYSTPRWKALRQRVFLRDRYRCQCGCGVLQGDTKLLVADHKKPHRGDPVLFWDEDNVQTLRKTCHDTVKRREEQATKHQQGVWDFRDTSAAKPAPSSGAMARPSWFRKSFIPLTVVCGPPGAGKSTYVKQAAGHNDLVICFDEVAIKRFGRKGEFRTRVGLTPDQIADVLRDRNTLIGHTMWKSATTKWAAAWIILTEPVAEHRQWWHDMTGASVMVLATPADECRRRIALDASAGDARGEDSLGLVDQWWRLYQPALCDICIK